MKIWTNNKFEGHWPVGTAAVVIAETAKDACEYLNIELKKEGLRDANIEDMEELPQVEATIRILNDGAY